jgi:hypothetical protein
MYGFCYLELASPDSSSNSNQGLTIIDRKLPKPFTNKEKIAAYRFPIGANNSIVHTFSFDFQMDDLMAGQTLYSTKLEISDAQNKETTDKQSDNIRYPISVATSANMEYFKNADGLHSINPVEVRIQKQLYDKKVADEKEAAKGKTPPTPKEVAEEKLAKDKEKSEKVKQASDTLKTNFIRFRLKDTDKKTHDLIYQDPGLLKYYLIKDPDPDSVLVSGVDVTIAIDGMAGFATADYFLIDGVPEIYNENGVFQITSIQQGINNEGWLTTITAGWMRKQI